MPGKKIRPKDYPHNISQAVAQNVLEETRDIVDSLLRQIQDRWVANGYDLADRGVWLLTQVELVPVAVDDGYREGVETLTPARMVNIATTALAETALRLARLEVELRRAQKAGTSE